MNWPTSLQQYLDSNSFQQEYIDPTIQSSNDVGPTKVRRRFTGLNKIIRGSITLPKSDFGTLENFFNVSTNGGVGSFYIPDPIAETPLLVRFNTPPSYSHIGGEYFKVNLSFRSI